MPSVQPALGAPPQTASNTVLFEMMMFYKRKMEIAEETAEQDRKRLKASLEVRNRLQDEVHATRHALGTAELEIQEYEQANQRCAEVIVNKHQGGLRLMNAFDELVGAIEVAAQFHRLRGEAHSDVLYIKDKMDTAVERATTAIEMFNQGTPISEALMNELQAEEVIDLTEEDTEEEDVGEWV